MSTPQAVAETGGDVLLKIFAALAHKGGVEMSMTLNVNGVVVTGLLVSRDSWLNDLSADLSSAGAAGASLAAGLRHGLDSSDEPTPDDETQPDADDLEPDNYAFLHLRNARYALGNGLIPVNRGLPLRVRITEIGGWSIGTMS